MRVATIHFNHDPTSAKFDAINLQLNADPASLVRGPEWRDGRQVLPVAYARDAVAEVRVKVTFADGPQSGTIEIRANAGAPGAESTLGGLAARKVGFDQRGDSQSVLFETTTGHFAHATVGKWAGVWSFEARFNPRSEWIRFAVVRYDVCMLVDLPNPPWTQDPTDPKWKLPWTPVLETACEWAAGTTTKVECQEAIARAINGVSLQRYVTAGTLAELDPAQFNLSEYLSRLNSPECFGMNCRDVASALISFANILGSELWPLGLNDTDTTQVRALVETTGGTHSWGFHEVTVPRSALPPGWQEDVFFTAGAPDPVPIYDACIHLPGNVEPLNMTFGSTVAFGSYRFRLIRPAGRDGVPIRPRKQRMVF